MDSPVFTLFHYHFFPLLSALQQKKKINLTSNLRAILMSSSVSSRSDDAGEIDLTSKTGRRWEDSGEIGDIGNVGCEAFALSALGVPAPKIHNAGGGGTMMGDSSRKLKTLRGVPRGDNDIEDRGNGISRIGSAYILWNPMRKKKKTQG
jgi:hypothetical protein